MHLLNRRIDKMEKNNKKECNLFNDELIDKKERFKNIINFDESGINILNSLFKKFYIMKPRNNIYIK
jgi:hypothetical protein